MVKIYIVGIVASGKTTYANQLAADLNCQFVELDSVVYHMEDGRRVKRSPEQQVEVVQEMDEKGSWVCEGVYRPSYHCVLELADIIIWLDPPLHTRRIRILKRHFKQMLRLEQSNYKPTFQMLKNMYMWTNQFERNRSSLTAVFQDYDAKLLVVKDNPIMNKDLNVMLEKNGLL